MQTIVNLHQGFHLNVFPIITIAVLFFMIVYFVGSKKAKPPVRKEFLTRSEAYKLIYNLGPEKETATAE